MPGNIKGITIEFDASTTALERKIKDVTNSTKAIDRELKNVNRALKFNPSSVTLWAQKQDLLKTKISETENKLKLLKQQQKTMDAQGVDKNSAEYRKLQREIVETESKLKHFKAELRSIGNVKLRALSEQFKAFGQQAMATGKQLTTSVTVPLAALGTVAVKKFAEVDKTMQLTNKTMQNGTEEAQLLDKAMKDAAANSTFGMSDAATATLNFARANLKARQAADLLGPAMNLAAGEGGNLDTVSAGLVATINSFGKDFENASTYVDVFANACNNSALDVDSLASSMSVAAPIFSAAGYKVNDAALYLGVMANKGIEANKAANSLKTGFARLITPAKDAQGWLEKLNFSITDENGNMKDTVTIQKELHDSFAVLSESEQIAAASAIFGKNQMAPWLSLIRTAPEDVAELNESLMETGTTEEMAAAMMSGFGGSLEKLKSSLDVAATSLGQALAPVILKIAQGIQILVDWFNQLSPRVQTVVAVLGFLAAAAGPVLMVIGAMSTGIGALIGVAAKIGPIFTVAKTAITAAGAVITPMGLAFVAVAALIMGAALLIYKHWDQIKAKAEELKAKISAAWTQIKTNTINQVNAMKASVTSAFSSLKATVSSIWNQIKTAITTPINTAVGIVKSAIAKIKSIINGAHFSLPHIKLPHFSISGKLSLNPPSVPKLSVSWYDQGGIFDRPTVIGVGEKRPEFVGALDDLRQIVREEAGGSGDNITINVYASQSMDVNQLAAAVEQRLVRLQKQRTKAWGY